MRFSLGTLLPALACLAQAGSALDGDLYIFDSHLSSTAAAADSKTRTVDPETARLIIASRLRLDQYHSLGHASEDALAAINDFSAQERLFASAADPAVALVLAAGVYEKDFAQRMHSAHHLQISNIPSTSNSEDLVLDLAMQSGIHSTSTKASQISELKKGLVSTSEGPAFRIVENPEDLFSTIETLTRQDYTVLALSVPAQKTCKHTYGKYSMPKPHQKRQQEAPLITDSSDSTFSNNPKAYATFKPAANNSSPLRGILPHCFSSLSSCQSITRNCTGHGSCALKYTDKDASNNGAPCYSCSCTSDVRTNKDGTKKTTQWGGPACQKKSVVVPFWLLAGFTVLMVFLIGWGIGLLWTMGEQELPSVIGAGVSGVSKK